MYLHFAQKFRLYSLFHSKMNGSIDIYFTHINNICLRFNYIANCYNSLAFAQYAPAFFFLSSPALVPPRLYRKIKFAVLILS